MRKFMKSIIASLLTVGLLLPVTAVPAFADVIISVGESGPVEVIATSEIDWWNGDNTNLLKKIEAAVSDLNGKDIVVNLNGVTVKSNGFDIATTYLEDKGAKSITFKDGTFDCGGNNIALGLDTTFDNCKANNIKFLFDNTGIENLKIVNKCVFDFVGPSRASISLDAVKNFTLTEATINGVNANTGGNVIALSKVKALINGNEFNTSVLDACVKAHGNSTITMDNNTFKNCGYALELTSSDLLSSFESNTFSYSTDEPFIGVLERGSGSAANKDLLKKEIQKNATYSNSDVNADGDMCHYFKAKSTSNTTSSSSSTTTTYVPTYVNATGDPYVYVGQNNINVTGEPTNTTTNPALKDAIITARNSTIKAGDAFNIMKNVKAKDNGGKGEDLTKKITVKGVINTKKAGTYTLTYSVTGANGNKVSKTVKLTVK